jgi:hypothetical protein
MTILQTIFVGIIAAIVGFHFQFRSWRHQNFERIREDERANAIEAITDISRQIDRRLTLQRRVVGNLEGYKLDKELQTNYRKILDDWNGEHSSRFARIQHIFDHALALKFYEFVHLPLQRNNAIADRYLKFGYENLSLKHKKETEELLKRLDAAQYSIKNWIRSANTCIDDGDLSQTRRINNINSNDSELITKTYLIKRLMKLSVSRP